MPRRHIGGLRLSITHHPCSAAGGGHRSSRGPRRPLRKRHIEFANCSVVDGFDRRRDAQPGGNGPLEEQSEHVTVERRHLLTDDDLARGAGELRRLEGTVDAVVVGDGHDREPDLDGAGEDFRRSGRAVAPRCVHVKVGDAGGRSHEASM